MKGGARVWGQYKLGFWIPTTCECKKFGKTCSDEVSPPPACRSTTPSTFTEQEMTFRGPHQGPKILEQKDQTNHSGDSNKPPIISYFSTKTLATFVACCCYPTYYVSQPPLLPPLGITKNSPFTPVLPNMSYIVSQTHLHYQNLVFQKSPPPLSSPLGGLEPFILIVLLLLHISCPSPVSPPTPLLPRTFFIPMLPNISCCDICLLQYSVLFLCFCSRTLPLPQWTLCTNKYNYFWKYRDNAGFSENYHFHYSQIHQCYSK